MSTAIESLNNRQLKSIFSDYNLGDVFEFRPAPNGAINTNYYISTSAQDKNKREAKVFPVTQEYVLTFLERHGQLNPALKSLLVSCAKAGLPVPRIFPNKAGAIQGTFKSQPLFVCSRMPGRPVFNPTITQCAAIGRFLARFHIASSSQVLESHPIDAEWLEQQSKRAQVSILPGDKHLLKDGGDSIYSMLSRTDVQNLPRGVIHGTLFRSNVLFNERGLSGAIGFNQAGYGFWLFDLALAVNDWCMDSNGESNNKKTLALLGAYHGIRSLAKEEFWYFPLFMLFAAISIWLKYITGNPVGNPVGNPKKYQCFRKIVELHTSRPFYLDERLF